MKVSKLTYNPKWSAILIIFLFLIGMLVGYYVERFRFSNYRWIYEYGKLINYLTVFGSLTWSFFNPVIVWENKKRTWRRYITWIIVGLLPLFCFAFIMILIFVNVYFF